MSETPDSLRDWKASIELWKERDKITCFMRDEIKKGLRDANGEPLPDVVNEFFLDLIFQRVKPIKGSRFMPSEEAIIRDQYRELCNYNRWMLLFEHDPHTGAPNERLRGEESSSERAKASLARTFETSPATIDQIANPRKSRQRRTYKPRQRREIR